MLGAVAGSRDIGGKQVADFRSFLLMRDQYRIEDNWHVAGLKGTGSKDIVVDDTFVPDYRTQSHLDYALNLPLPGQEVNKGPLFRLPFSVVFNVFRAATGRAIFLDHPQQRFQDVQAALAHAYLLPDPVAKAVGGMVLGASKQEVVV